jgi:hypothetical protein
MLAMGSWSVGLFANSHVVMKVIPTREGDAPRFRLVPTETGVRNMSPFGEEWELTDDGVGQWE